MGVFDKMARDGHEQVTFFHDEESGLKAFVALHDTTLGSALGGCRMYDYPTEEEALEDVLRLSLGMTAKSAVTQCNHGGGKAVIWGDPDEDKDEALLRAFGRFIDGMRGRFVTGTDLGTEYEDFVVAGQETKWLVGLPEYAGGSGNTSITTAYGVFHGIRATAAHVWGTDDLNGKTVAVQGVGKVGSVLVDHLIEAGCDVYVTDVDEQQISAVKEEYDVQVVAPEEIYDVDCDIFAPCAMGGILNEDTIDRLQCKVIAGAANNQLADEQVGRQLHRRGVLYAPDYIINAGGLLQVADEMQGFNRDRVMRKTAGLYDLLLECFSRAEQDDVPPFVAADKMVWERIEKLAEVNRIYLPN